jgi:hypothetical protein
MPIGQLQYPEWIGKGEPAGAPLLRGAQAGAAIAGSFTQAYNASQNRKFQERQLNIQEEHAKLQRMQVGADLYMQSKAQRDQQEGEVEWAKWNAQYGEDPVAMMDAPMPQTDYAAQRATSAKVAASQTTLAKQYGQHIADFNRRVSALDGDLASPFYGAVKEYPTPDQWKAVGIAEETMSRRVENRAAKERAEEARYDIEKVEAQSRAYFNRSSNTAVQRDATKIVEMESNAKVLRQMGDEEGAATLEKTAALMRQRVERVNTLNNSLIRKTQEAKARLEYLRGLAASGTKYMSDATTEVKNAIVAQEALLRSYESQVTETQIPRAQVEPSFGDGANLWDEFQQFDQPE